MKVTHDFLKKLILEELNRSLILNEGPDGRTVKTNISPGSSDKPKPKQKKKKPAENPEKKASPKPQAPKDPPTKPKKEPDTLRNVRSSDISPEISGDIGKTGAGTPIAKGRERRDVNIDQLLNQPPRSDPRKKVNIDQLSDQPGASSAEEPPMQIPSPKMKPDDEKGKMDLRRNTDKQMRILLFYERMLQQIGTPPEIQNIVRHVKNTDTVEYLTKILGVKETVSVKLSSLIENPIGILVMILNKVIKEAGARLEMKLSEGFEMPTIEEGVTLESLLEEVDKMYQEQKK